MLNIILAIDILKLCILVILPARRLISCAVVERPLQPLLAVGCVSRRSVPNERPQMFDEFVGRGEAADAEGQLFQKVNELNFWV